MSKSRTVRVYPDPSGMFLDGIPAIEQDVPESDAVWMVHSGAFTSAPPQPPSAAVKQPEGPADAVLSDTKED